MGHLDDLIRRQCEIRNTLEADAPQPKGAATRSTEGPEYKAVERGAARTRPIPICLPSRTAPPITPERPDSRPASPANPTATPPSQPYRRVGWRKRVPVVTVAGGPHPQEGTTAGAATATPAPTAAPALVTSPALVASTAPTAVTTGGLPASRSSWAERHAAHPEVAAVFAEARALRAAGKVGAAEKVLLENRLIGLGLSGEIPPRDAFDLQYELDKVLQGTNTAVAAVDRN